MSDLQSQDAPATQQARTGPNPNGDFIWYELMANDADGAKDFYDAVVDWDIGQGAAEYQGYRMINSNGGLAGGVLPITDEMREHGARPTWLGYIYVSDVDAKVASIEASSGRTLMPPSDIPNVGRIAMVADPQGAPFYVMKPIPPQGRENEPSTVFSPSANGRCGWNELQTSDVEGARHFYAEQFGWESGDFMDMGELGQYRFFDNQGLRIGALFSAANGQPPHWRFYFRVPSISAARQTAEQKGGTIHMGPHQVPGGDFVIIGSDPQGAEFALVGGA